MKVAVVGASSGLGRAVALGLGERGHEIALLARREDRLARAVQESSGTAHAVRCDVTDEEQCHDAVTEAVERLGGLDALVYSTGVGTLGRLSELGADAWTHSFATNVTGAAIATRAALPHLRASDGCAIYFSTVSASMTPVWPGLGAYITSKAALDKMVEAWRAEHPDVGFTRLIVGDCGGGEGDSAIGFTDGWDRELLSELGLSWYERGYVAGALLDVAELTTAVENVAAMGNTAVVPSIAVLPRVPQGDDGT